MTASPQCHSCGSPLSGSTLEGLCPRCTAQIGFGFAFQSPDGEEEPFPVESASEGTPFGDYVLLKEIARGGMGIVYRARQRGLNRLVAVKMILGGQFASMAQVQRFRQEAEAAANLQHPNIVSIHEIGEVDGQHFFSMDLVEGRNLAEIVHEQPLPHNEAAALVQTIAEAVHQAHQQGVVHRDLKPSNVLLDQNGTPHVTDFGLAKRLPGDDPDALAHELTLSGQVLGSPAFAAPEQAGGAGDPASPSIDVYSLGALFYHLLTGRPPFVSDSLEHTLAMVLATPPPPPRVLIPTLPRDLDTICLKCLEKDPARRYPSAQALAEDLGRALRGESIVARPATVVEQAWRWAGRNRLLASVTALAILLLGGGIAGVLSQWRRAESHAANENIERARAERALTNLQLQHAELHLRGGETAEGLAYLAEILCNDPGHRVAAERLVSVLSHRSLPLPIGPPLRHQAAVTSAAFSPDGNCIVTTSEDRTARVWDAGTGEAITPELHHESSVLSARFDAAGERIVTATHDGAARVWDAQSGEPLTPVLEHESPVLFAGFHPSGSQLLTGTADGKARVWDLPAGTLHFDPISHQNELSAVAYSPDGKSLLTAGRFDGIIRISDASDGRTLKTARWNKARIESAAFSPDGTRLAAIAYQNSARVWDLTSGQELFRGALKSTGSHLAFSPDGELLATASRAGRAAVWDLATGKLVREFTNHQTWVEQVEFSSDGLRLLTREFGRRAHVWDLVEGTPVVAPLVVHTALHDIHFDPAGERLIAATGDGHARLWDVRPGAAQPLILNQPGTVRSVGVQHDGTQALVASDDGTVTLWETNSGRQVRQHRFPSAARATLSPDGSTALVGLFDGSVIFWDLASDRRREQQGTARIQHLEFSPDGTLALTAGFGTEVHVWDVATATLAGPPLRHPARLWHASFSPDGQRVVTATDDWRNPRGDNIVRVWDPRKGTTLSPPMRHQGGIYHAVFSPDGSRLLTSSFDHSAAIWNPATGRRLATMHHESVVRVANFDRSGSRVVTASWDNTARVWDAHSGQPLTPPLRHRSELYFADFSPDEQHVVTGSADGKVQLWDAETGSPLSDPLAHDGSVYQIEFLAGNRFLVCGGQSSRIWSRPGVNGSTPAWLPTLAQALGGMQIDHDAMRTFDQPRRWHALRNEIEESPLAWASWLVADRDERTLAPGLETPLPEGRQRLANLSGIEGASEAVRLAPHEADPWKDLAQAVIDTDPASAEVPPLAEYASRKSVRLAPDRQDLWLARLDPSRPPSDQLLIVDAALQHHPAHGEFLVARGKVLVEMEEFRRAAESFRTACEANGDRGSRLFAQAADGHRDCLLALGETARARELWLEAHQIPARSVDCPAHCLDLSSHYNAALDEPWHNRRWKGNDLAALLDSDLPPTATPFDLRGVVQLNGRKLAASEAGFPARVDGIPVARATSRLHFLHGAAWGYFPREGTTIGAYHIRYQDGSDLEVPLITGRNIHEWHLENWPNNDLPEAELIDLGTNRGKARIRLYHFVWENPNPEKPIASLDFTSAMTDAAPFLVALTAEP